jgi:hypothetical protein
VASIEDPGVIARILAHRDHALGRVQPQRALYAARAPPGESGRGQALERVFESTIRPTLARAHEGHVTDPDAIGRARNELAFEQV